MYITNIVPELYSKFFDWIDILTQLNPCLILIFELYYKTIPIIKFFSVFLILILIG